MAWLVVRVFNIAGMGASCLPVWILLLLQQSMSVSSVEPDREGCFGMRKVVGHRADARGAMQFKVEWEATWEPAENFSSCQNLVNEYWKTFVAENSDGKPLKKKLRLESTVSDILQDFRLTEELKLGIQQLLTAENLQSSRDIKSTWPYVPAGNSLEARTLDSKPAANTPMKKQQDRSDRSSSSPSSTSASAVQYIENFASEYVKIVLVCKVCNAEQPLKRPADWKRHFLTHVSDDEKPHKCIICGKAFIRREHLVKHAKTHEKASIKTESAQ